MIAGVAAAEGWTTTGCALASGCSSLDDAAVVVVVAGTMDGPVAAVVADYLNLHP